VTHVTEQSEQEQREALLAEYQARDRILAAAIAEFEGLEDAQEKLEAKIDVLIAESNEALRQLLDFNERTGK
jgi:hypothetical protein